VNNIKKHTPHPFVDVLFEDNHVIVVNKQSSVIVQGDKTGDASLIDYVKAYIKDKYKKDGNVFLGLVHRLDRPVSGIVIFARTSKALTRLNEDFKNRSIEKKYWAITKNKPEKETALLTHFLIRDTQKNKSFAFIQEKKDSKKAQLEYKTISHSQKYFLLEINLLTGRHHQIRAQLAAIGCPIKGDLKYGSARSNADASICLHAASIAFKHPTSKELIKLTTPLPQNDVWKFFNIKPEQA